MIFDKTFKFENDFLNSFEKCAIYITLNGLENNRRIAAYGKAYRHIRFITQVIFTSLFSYSQFQFLLAVRMLVILSSIFQFT